MNTVLGNVKRALDGTYHAWGQKYAPRYLAEFSYRFNRRYQLADLVPRLAHVAVQTPPLPYRLLTVAGLCVIRNFFGEIPTCNHGVLRT